MLNPMTDILIRREGNVPGSSVVKTAPSDAGGMGFIPGREAKIPGGWWPKCQNIKQKQYFNKLHIDFKNGPH